jgi:glutamate-1-semialdehyde 2,1-aminomutase|tara:strand:+ start:2813 stop:4102 length:1290 start_codon:yes stop_codon:yes gene_type:complete
MYKNSKNAFRIAKDKIPGGVNSPVRAFKSVDGSPIFFKKGSGSKMIDIDNNEYIDCISSWGPLIFGHCNKNIIKSINNTVESGSTFGACTTIETEMADKITQYIPSVEKVRMVNSGTEATMSAIRLARGFTKKELIIKFSGNYHGHGDSFLIKAGSGAFTLGLPDSPGVTKNTAKDTLTAEYNDLKSVEELFKNNRDNIAAVIIEPIAGNMGLVKPIEGFLQGLRKICDKNNSILIFDEVMTGFRVSKGGAQELYNVKPDITTLGKIIGGGLPVGAYGGKKEIMNMLAPEGPIYQAGTLSGNPLAMSAGLTTLKMLNKKVYIKLEDISKKIEVGWKKNIKETETDACIARVGSMLTLFFTSKKQVSNYNDALECDTKMYAKYFKLMLDMGIYLPPSQYESLFLSSVMTDNDISKLIKSNKIALEKLKYE